MPGSTVIMTETLPTIVGAGVISRTTDTMFGKSKRKSSKSKTKGRGKVAKRKSTSRSAAAKKGWRTRRKRYGKNGVRG